MVMVLIVATIAVAMIVVVATGLNECGAGQRAVTGVMNGHYVSLCIDK